MTIILPIWPYAYGSPSGTGKIRVVPEDFIVEETLSFETSGSGEHVFLQIQKSGENTEYVARQLAKFANIRQRDIGYAGLKDRHALTTQWFSVWLPGKAELDWSAFVNDHIKVMQTMRHARKLKRGVLSGNRFKILIRDWQGDPAKIFNQLELIKTNGIPNYYGEQRFGRYGQNVNQALTMFSGTSVNRDQRSIYLSAARSFLFNQILAFRVKNNTWNQALPGDTYQFSGSKSCFKSQNADAEILRRVDEKIIHPTGVLWGKGEADVSGDALEIEQTVIDQYVELAQGLINAGLEKDRRTLRVNVDDLSWEIDEKKLRLSFSLPAGSYATALLRELIQLHG